MSLKTRKIIFYIMMAVAFIAVALYQFLTPYLSDDIIYMDEVRKAGSFFELFSQEANQWVSHTGRSVSHIILRIFLYIGNKGIFNIVASAVFLLLSLLIYLNVFSRKEYDIRLYGFILVMLWFFDPAIANTVFWMDGACNYLFTTTIVMGFITLYRLGFKDGKNSAGYAVLLFILGIAAGWCNENTSGGVILFVLIELIYHYILNKKSFSYVKPWMITGFLGCLFGFVMMIVAPGNYGRLAVTEEEHTGLLALLARFLKITLNIKNGYPVLVAAFIVCVILILYCFDKSEERNRNLLRMAMFGILFVATCYALIMVPSSELRSYYGASIFIMTAIAQGISVLSTSGEKLLQALLTAIVSVYCMLFVLSYFDDGANLARIKRETDERDAYLTSVCVEGGEDVYAPMLRPLWQTRFSAAYEVDIQEDWQFWINFFLSQHYGLGTISGVDREEWTEY